MKKLVASCVTALFIGGSFAVSADEVFSISQDQLKPSERFASDLV